MASQTISKDIAAAQRRGERKAMRRRLWLALRALAPRIDLRS